MRALVIGDTHFDDKYPGYLDAQIEAIRAIVLMYCNKVDKIIFLGDIFDKRSPKPSVTLKVLALLRTLPKPVVILRGNHDSETKSDDGVSILNILNVFDDVNVVYEWDIEDDTDFSWHYIPHYENEETIKFHLARTKPNDLVFGHFGFNGCINSVGDYDFSIDPSALNCTAILGHIHHYKRNSNWVVLGTPYATSFQEKDKRNYVAIVEQTADKLEIKEKEVTSGPKYYVTQFNEIDKLKELKKPKKAIDDYRILRVLVDPTEEASEYNVLTKIKDKLHVDWIDIKFNITSPDYNKEDVSFFKPKRELFSINEAIIEDYIDKANSSFTKGELLSGLKDLQDENK